MKKKIISAVLILAILMSNILISTASALGTQYGEASAALAENVELAKGVFFTDARQEEHYITYKPNGTIIPVVVSGAKLLDKGDFSTFAALLESKGMNVVCGVNGDYYVVATAMPVGVIIEEGKLKTSDDGNWAIGFNSDGRAFFGKPALKSQIYIKTETYRLGGINKAIAKDDYYLYTDDYGADTGINFPTRNVIFTYPEGVTALTPDCELELTVEAVFDSEGPAAIPEGKLVMSLLKGGDSWRDWGINNLTPGDKIKMNLNYGEGWGNAEYAMGSLYRLAENGVKAEGLDDIDDDPAPRTAVGIKPDGTVIFYTVDGRQSDYSKGLTLSEVADRLLELGCTEAGALDGGGSTNIQARYPGDSSYTPANIPSFGREREVTSYIMLAAKNPGSGIAKTLTVRPYDAVMLAGTGLQLTAGACDEIGRPVPSSGLTVWSADKGAISSDGKLTAPEEETDVIVTAAYGTLKDSVPVKVIKSPDTITIKNEETGRALHTLTLDVKQTVELSAEAMWHNLDVSAADTDFTWSVDGSIGSIDGDGTLTASSTGGVGYVTAKAGDCVYELSVAIKTGIMTGDDFENAEAGSSEGVKWSKEISADYVRYGYGSLKAEYNLAEGPAKIPLGLDWAKISRFATLWIYGDGSGNKIYVNKKDTEVFVADLNYTGWRQFTVNTGFKGGISGLTIAGSGKGTVWFDQILLTDIETPDLEAPYMTLGVNKLMVSGTVTDAVDGYPAAANISLTLDGEPIAFQYDELTGDIYAAIEESGEIRRLTLTAHDSSGNVYSVSASTEGEFEGVFGDIGGHWAANYVNYMHKLGVAAGIENKNGGLDFKPDSQITRAQFAAMICRWMKIDTNLYEDTPLNFSDTKDIPAWAVNYVKAVSALGLIKGMLEKSGVYFRPNDTLTRAQAMTVLGRTMEGGRMSADLCFNDIESIPSWAVKYVSELVFAGVIRGYDDNTLRPEAGLTRAQVCKILTEMT